MAQVHVKTDKGKERYGDLNYSGIFTRHIPSCDVIKMDRSIKLDKQLIQLLRDKGGEVLQLIVASAGRRLFFRIPLDKAVELAEERGEMERDCFRVRVDDCRMADNIPICTTHVEKLKEVVVEVTEPVKEVAQQKLFELTTQHDY